MYGQAYNRTTGQMLREVTRHKQLYGTCANAFFVVLPSWKSFYESNEDGSIKDIRRDVNFVDYAIKWNKKRN